MGIVPILTRARTGALAAALTGCLIGCTSGHYRAPASLATPPPTSGTGGVTLLVVTTLSAPGFDGPTSEELMAITGAWQCWSWDVAVLAQGGVLVETHLLITRSRVPAARSVIGRLPRATVTQSEPIGFAVPPSTADDQPATDRGPC